MGALTGTVWVQKEPGVDPVAFGPDDSEIPGWALDLMGDHCFEDGERPDGEDKPYAKWLKADLEAEVSKRNEGREEADLIEVGGTGKVADLAAALDADDAR